MKKKTIKFTALAAACGITLLACGCGGNGNQTNPTNRTTNVYSSLVDYSVHSDTRVSDIMVWRPPTDLSDEQWQWLKESGVNTVMTDSGIGGQRGAQFGSDSQKSYIEQCRKFGLSAMGYTNGNYNKNVKDYGDTDFYDTIAGIDYDDEPNINEFDAIAEVIPDFSEKYSGKKFFVCMLSGYSGEEHLGTTDYKEYLNAWYDKVLSQLPEGMPRVLATDIYPCHDSQNYGYEYINALWLRSLAYMGEMKIKHPELTLHIAMQSMSYGIKPSNSPRRAPTENDCKFQVYVNAAFGFTDFSWFTYSMPPADDIEFTEDNVAMLDKNNQRTSVYYAVQKANALIADLDEVLKSVSFAGVMPIAVKSATKEEQDTDDKAMRYLAKIDGAVITAEDFDVLKSAAADHNALISRFSDEGGNEGYMLVNYGDPGRNKPANVTLNLIDCNEAIIYRNGKPQTVSVKNNKLTVALEAGEGVYLIPYKK